MAQIWNYKCMFGDPERKSPLTVLKFATRYRTSVLLEFLLSWLKSSTRNGCTLMPRHEKTDWNWESVASHPRPDMGRQWTPKIIRNVSYWIGKAMIQGILILRDRFQFQDSSSWRPASIIWRWHMGPGSFHPGQHRPLEARHSTDNMVVVWLAWKRLRGIHPLCPSLSLFQSFKVLVFYTSTYTYVYIHIHIYTYIHIYIYTYIYMGFNLLFSSKKIDSWCESSHVNSWFQPRLWLSHLSLRWLLKPKASHLLSQSHPKGTHAVHIASN